MVEVMDNKFSDWLLDEMLERTWSQSDLARASGLTRQAISYYISGKSKSPDRDALQKIAKAFKIPLEAVFRQAGLLPRETKKSELTETILHELDQLPEREREDMLQYIRLRREIIEKRKLHDTNPKTRPAIS